MKKFFIVILCLAAVIALVWGGLVYKVKYRIEDIDAALSPDGGYEIVFQSVGEPDFPFGDSHARIVLKEDGRVVAKLKFDVANDGAALFPENWSLKWRDDCVQAAVSGEEQEDALYIFYFDGRVEAGE